VCETRQTRQRQRQKQRGKMSPPNR
jgi:hypothetical protein